MSPGLRAQAPGLTVREDSVDLLSSDLALRCGDRGEAEASGRGASLGRSRFLGNALFSLRPCRVSLEAESPVDKLVSMCSAFSVSRASNFSITWDLLQERARGH